MTVKTIGLDLAKDVFQVHGISETGRKVFNKKIKRANLLEFFETLPRCVVGMEACGSAHHWGRELRKLGRDVRLMPATYVKPYVKRGKSDAADPEPGAVQPAVADAVSLPAYQPILARCAALGHMDPCSRSNNRRLVEPRRHVHPERAMTEVVARPVAAALRAGE